MHPRRFLVPGLLAAACTAAAAQERAPAQPLPLKNVVLFSSGVGYFHRAGRVPAGATVDLSFRAEQVNDILKSLVLLDPAGAVRPVTYSAQEPALRRLGPAAQNLNGTLSLGSLLRQFQGARVRVEVGGEAIEGRIVSVSLKPVPAPPGQPVQQEVLNVLTETGLRSVSLEQAGQVRLLDERLDRELRESLALLATGLDEQRRIVQLRFGGDAAREVQAGYLQEMPVWKTSYRLVLDAGKAPFLQGWAHVENTTDEDWREVRLSLVSGRPISFIQDLYQPLYVPRPVVQAQVIGSPNPQSYGEVLEREGKQDVAGGLGGGLGGGGFGRAGARPRMEMRGPAGPAGPPAAAPAPLAADAAKSEAFGRKMAEQLSQSAAAQAEGTERGALFEYAVKQPVTLSKGQAAMVPIAAAEVAGEAVSIFDADSDTRYALNGFRLKNTTGLHLSGGPITVFRDGVYAGDAQIGNLQPGEDRLLSYAVDLDLVADREEPKFRQETLTVTAKSGVLHIQRKQQRERVYTFRNKSQEAKRVLVQQNVDGDDFKLAQPAKPLEKTPEEYRFQVDVPAGKTESLKVVTERPVTETVALLEADLNLITAFSQNAQVSERLRGALKDLALRRRKITDLQAQRGVLEGQIREITQEQDRIRQNMAQLDRNSPLHMQYVKKLTDQETRIEQIREQIVKLREAEAAAQKELREFVETLSID